MIETILFNAIKVLFVASLLNKPTSQEVSLDLNDCYIDDTDVKKDFCDFNIIDLEYRRNFGGDEKGFGAHSKLKHESEWDGLDVELFGPANQRTPQRNGVSVGFHYKWK